MSLPKSTASTAIISLGLFNQAASQIVNSTSNSSSATQAPSIDDSSNNWAAPFLHEHPIITAAAMIAIPLFLTAVTAATMCYNSRNAVPQDEERATNGYKPIS